ncbi:MAG: type IX secretion system protein PorQ [Bacteroidales bacterium]
MFKKAIIASSFLLQVMLCMAKIGGKSTYSFLKVNSSPKLAAMGGVLESPIYNDVSMIAYNPSLLDSTLHQQIGINYLYYPGNISNTTVSGAFCYKYGTFGANLTSFNYGSIDSFDELGESLGMFTANEFSVNVYYSRSILKNINISVGLSNIISQLERYKSYGLAVHLGARYLSNDRLFSSSLLIKNIGHQIIPYTSGNYESLPFEIQWSVSKKLSNAPFGVSLTLTDLQNFKIYNNLRKKSAAVDNKSESLFMRASKELLCHINIGATIIPSKYFTIMGGYNFRRQNELSVGEKLGGGAGFSLGFSVHLRRFEINYGLAMYHIGANSNHIGLIFKLYNP